MNNDNRHCSECVHYEACQDFRIYCKALQRRITARKSAKNCKYYKSFIKKEMNEEDYVSLKIAKLLKEKGFDVPCCSCPTLYEVQK